MAKRRIEPTHKGDERSPHREDVNRVLNEQDHPGKSLPDDQRIKSTTVPHKGRRQPYGQRDGRK